MNNPYICYWAINNYWFS